MTDSMERENHPLSSDREFEDQGQQGQTVGEQDFIATGFGTPRGAAQSWWNLRAFAERHDDFPLRPYQDDPRKLIGDIEDAKSWIDDHYRHQRQPIPVFRTILERLMTTSKTRKSSG